MNKPHVDKLHYRMILKDGVDYDKAPPLTDKSDIFTMTAIDNKVVFKMKAPFDNQQDARQVTDRYLDEWSILIGLKFGPDEITFKFDRSDIIDLEPNTGSVILGIQSISQSQSMSGRLRIVAHRNKYPDPPKDFSVSPDVETMFNRFKAYHDGRDKLLSMAYLVLTVFISNAGSKWKAVDKFNIADKVIVTLKRLCASGDKTEARKAHNHSQFVPLTGKEKTWILAACKLIIERVGTYESCGPDDLLQLTMADLPPL